LKVSADNSELIIPDDSALVGRKGKKIPAGKLKPGDKVLALVDKEGMGRHFGMAVEETIIEK
ncbi:MAG: 3-dehydroquinate synthase II, partial [Candidatus Altiarchaeota archaeon]|nr:3-dehydroquinate synthase II [Candidatus Altiarchaeota archaeon]